MDLVSIGAKLNAGAADKRYLPLSGCADVWHEAQRIRPPEREHREFLKTAHISANKEKKETYAIALFISFSLIAITGTGFVYIMRMKKFN